MKICATCLKPIADEDKICSHCGMQTKPHNSPGFDTDYRYNSHWTLFPPIPKTHWWGADLELRPAGRKGIKGSVLSNGFGEFVVGPKQLDLEVGLYEFHCFLSLNKIPITRRVVGNIQVLHGTTPIVERPIRVEDFDAESKEALIIIEIQLEAPSEHIQCQFSSNGIPNVNISLIWMRLVPQFGWKWDRWNRKGFLYDKKASVSEQGVTLEASPHEGGIKLWGPYMSLPSGFYELIAFVSVTDSSETPLMAQWEVTADHGKTSLQSLKPLELDLLQYGTAQTIIRRFYLESGEANIEFRIIVEQGQIIIHWIRLIPPEGHIWRRYYELGGRDSMLGLPLSAEARAIPSDNGTRGRYRRFERGSIYFNNRTFQAWEVWGAVSSLFENRKKLEDGSRKNQISFPTSSIQPAQSSYGTIGEFQRFEGWGDATIFAYLGDRSHICAIYGAISSKYWETDGPTGPLGFPTSEREYDWSKNDVTFRRSDFEGGYITWLPGETTVHYYPKPHVIVECPESIQQGEELRIIVTGELDRGPARQTYLSVAFPHSIDASTITIVEATSRSISIAKPGDSTYGKYGKPGYELRYPRVELGGHRGSESKPDASMDSFEISLRPAEAGTLHIFVKMCAQDDENLEFWGSDPDRKMLEPQSRTHTKSTRIERDQQDEAVYVYEVNVLSSQVQEDNNFDVFLCHNGINKPEVKRIAQVLKDRGIAPWLDEWELPPGRPFIPLLEQQIKKIKSAAVFVGKDSIGPWEQVELEAFLRQFVKRGCPVIPVILADAPEEPQLPTFLEGMIWVDFRKQDPNPIEQLIFGITGKRS